jgi:hypothetical protein
MEMYRNRKDNVGCHELQEGGNGEFLAFQNEKFWRSITHQCEYT